jgi:thiol-disulfide isomerase/thioredoxin
MNLLHAATMMVALSATGASSNETVLLDFGADWCGYCRQMEPILSQLSAEGYPVRKVNVDHDHALAEKYGVQGLPCFVMVVGGKEVDRVVGATDRTRLTAMFRRNGVTPDGKSARAPALLAEAPARPIKFPRSDAADEDAADAAADPRSNRLIRSSVRLHITDRTGISCGSGTIIDAREGEALILTCGHMFRDSDENSRIAVDLFGPRAPQHVAGRLIDYDLASEIGILSIETKYPVEVASVAPRSYKIHKGDDVTSVGCDGGGDCTAKETTIKSINRYGGAANLQVGFQPVQGRSGGGLFTSDGQIIGICNAGDPADNEGVFTHLSVIHDALDRAGLTFVYRNREDSKLAQLADASRPRRDRQLELAAVREPIPESRDLAARRIEPARAGTDDTAALVPLRDVSPDAEVICIVRQHGQAKAQNEIVVIDHASPAFLRQLNDERRQQQIPTSAR